MAKNILAQLFNQMFNNLSAAFKSLQIVGDHHYHELLHLFFLINIKEYLFSSIFIIALSTLLISIVH